MMCVIPFYPVQHDLFKKQAIFQSKYSFSILTVMFVVDFKRKCHSLENISSTLFARGSFPVLLGYFKYLSLPAGFQNYLSHYIYCKSGIMK